MQWSTFNSLRQAASLYPTIYVKKIRSRQTVYVKQPVYNNLCQAISLQQSTSSNESTSSNQSTTVYVKQPMFTSSSQSISNSLRQKDPVTSNRSNLHQTDAMLSRRYLIC
ncbi:hypothetical protein LOAG_11563 [Loa loa]|uniref:Uncharacterized protein n=1 Tax=Loa loa TaxID=7209 RepID=A0A1S0TMU7_LOALO|nr:hypothetical protein LOAG_11563 [Loa loa]EFO16939.1 hypothetical protein LOAG_11563 [Loa loa]